MLVGEEEGKVDASTIGIFGHCKSRYLLVETA